jgi:hypothetical protein
MLDDVPKMVNPVEYCIKVPEYRGGVDLFLMSLENNKFEK